MNPPERITPLPWKIEIQEKEASTPSISILDANQRFLFCALQSWPNYHEMKPATEQQEQAKANAEYIVHACNNYPKLEALNAELVDVIERGIIKNHNFDLMYLTELIQKAKGG